MSRPPRLDYPGARHHVMNRGARHAQIFHDEGDCLRFLGILQDLPTRFGILVHGYVSTHRRPSRWAAARA